MEDLYALELADIASSSGTPGERARAMIGQLRSLVNVDAAWVALAEPSHGRLQSLLAIDLDERTHRYLGGPTMADDVDRTGMNRRRPPLSPSDLPYPAAELPTWADCLIPAGFHEALTVALFTSDRRHVGFLALLSGDRRPPSEAARRRLHALTTLLASGVDPLQSLATSARMLEHACAGAALCRDGTPLPLPGLTGDRLLVGDSPLIALARWCLADGHLCSSFLWPTDDRLAPDAHLRVTVLACPDGSAAGLLGAVVLAPAPDLHGLTRRELEVLGCVIDGMSNQQIARALFVTPRTVATHVEHILVKLDASTRTLAAVRALRQGLFIPSPPPRAQPVRYG